MKRSVKLLILVSAAVLAIIARSDSVAQDKPSSEGKFTGVPRDIDYIKNAGWTQIIVQGNVPTESLVAETKNDRIESVLLVALSLRIEVTVAYVEGTPKTLASVKLPLVPRDEQGYVSSLSVSEKDSYCRAVIFDQSKKVTVWTKSVQMQRVLETAAQQSIPVQELSYDSGTMEITRGKVNVELPR